MGRDCLFAQRLAQLMGDSLGQFARVDEHQCAAVRLNMLGEAIVDFSPLLGRADGFEFAGRAIDAQIELALMAGVDDRAVESAECGVGNGEWGVRSRA